MAPGLGTQAPIVKGFSTPPRFAVDAMLGRMATWLRLLGFDTTFDPALGDDALICVANAQGRWLVTADRSLASRPSLRRVVLVPPSPPQAQWECLVASVNLAPWIRPLTRCPRCNTVLVPLCRDRVRDRVPPHVLDSHQAFSGCTSCGRVYWPGSHTQQVLQAVRRLVPGDAGACDGTVPVVP